MVDIDKLEALAKAATARTVERTCSRCTSTLVPYYVVYAEGPLKGMCVTCKGTMKEVVSLGDEEADRSLRNELTRDVVLALIERIRAAEWSKVVSPTPTHREIAETIWRNAYESNGPCDLGSAMAKRALVPAIAQALVEAEERGRTAAVASPIAAAKDRCEDGSVSPVPPDPKFPDMSDRKRGITLPQAVVKRLVVDGSASVWLPGPTPSVGEEMFVKETWQVTTGREPGDLGAVVRYRADGSHVSCQMPERDAYPPGVTWGDRWRASTTMPRWASRLVVQVERQQSNHVVDLKLVKNIGWDINDPSGDH